MTPPRSTTAAPRLLTAADVAAALAAKGRDQTGLLAMYSSYLDGVVTDPDLMTLPIDDHLVHRGHGVFDTATLANGKMYRLEAHLDRFLRSASLARIAHPWSRDELRAMVLATAAVSGVRDASVRYWLSPGPGGFGISPDECTEACFYCVLFDPAGVIGDAEAMLERGIPEATIVDTPMKPQLLATIKSTNYMLNVLMHLEALDKGGTFGVHVTPDGMLAESCVLNVCLVLEDETLVTPPFDGILAGTTVGSVLRLCESHLVREGLLRDARQAPVEVAAAWRAGIREMFVCGGDTHIFPVVSWDGTQIGNGEVGPVTKRLVELLGAEADGDGADLIDVSYV